MPQAGKTKSKTRPPFKVGRFLWSCIKLGFVLFVVIPVLWVAVYRFMPPPITFTMVERAAQGKGLDYRWRPLTKISPALVNAAIAAEDARFCTHHGIDFEAVEKALENNERRPGRVRGGSTITQQTAKNVFLWQHRDWVRKGFETYFTGLIEVIWGKRRIMEVYLNVAEMGPGTYGAEAAAQRYFNVSASDLTSAQASRLVAILPSPLRYKAVGSGPYVQRRSRRIGGAAGTVRREGMSACVLRPNDRRAPADEPRPESKSRPAKAAAPPAEIVPVEAPPADAAPPPADPIGEILAEPAPAPQ